MCRGCFCLIRLNLRYLPGGLTEDVLQSCYLSVSRIPLIPHLCYVGMCNVYLGLHTHADCES